MKKNGEKTGNNMILRNVDGSHVSEVYLNRYIVESDDINKASISIDISVKLDDAEYFIKTKEIKIKYCPFCGEEL